MVHLLRYKTLYPRFTSLTLFVDVKSGGNTQFDFQFLKIYDKTIPVSLMRNTNGKHYAMRLKFCDQNLVAIDISWTPRILPPGSVPDTNTTYALFVSIPIYDKSTTFHTAITKSISLNSLSGGYQQITRMWSSAFLTQYVNPTSIQYSVRYPTCLEFAFYL